jgi:hypothetical protein
MEQGLLPTHHGNKNGPPIEGRADMLVKPYNSRSTLIVSASIMFVIGACRM